MSAASAWSYTHTATHWPLIGRDDWKGVLTFGAPVAFACDYKAEAKRKTDAKGVEFITTQVFFTERSTIQPGDRLLIGASVSADPIAVGALEVRSVARFADTFDSLADDFKVSA
jgi:hypothetical protein